MTAVATRNQSIFRGGDRAAPRSGAWRRDHPGRSGLRRGPHRLQRHDRQAPGPHRAMRRCGRCDGRRDLCRRRTILPIAVRGGGHNAAGLGTCDDGTRHRPEPHERGARQSRHQAGAGGRRRHLGRCRPRHRSLRAGGAVRHHLHHRRRRAHPGRRVRLSQPRLRADHRQSGLRRSGAGRWLVRDGQRVRALRSLLGHPRRWRQLRRGDRLRVPGAARQHGHRWRALLRARQVRGADEALPRLSSTPPRASWASSSAS